MKERERHGEEILGGTLYYSVLLCVIFLLNLNRPNFRKYREKSRHEDNSR